MIDLRPAQLDDLPHVAPLLPPRMLAALTHQLNHSMAVTAVKDGEALAVIGLYQHPQALELWFMVRPDLRGTARARRLLLELHRLWRDRPVLGAVFCSVQHADATGLRLVRLMGFTRDISAAGDRFHTFALEAP